MAFNNITNGDPFDATKAMQNWRNVNYGSTLLPVNSSGAAVNATIDLGSSSNAFKDGFFSGQIRAAVQPFLYLHTGSRSSTGIDFSFTVGENTGGFTTTGGKLAVPSPGVYTVSVSGYLSALSYPDTQEIYIVKYNSSDVEQSSVRIFLYFSGGYADIINGSGIFRMAAGDYLAVRANFVGTTAVVIYNVTIYKLPS